MRSIENESFILKQTLSFSVYAIIIHNHHTQSSYTIIIHNHHTQSSYTIIVPADVS